MTTKQNENTSLPFLQIPVLSHLESYNLFKNKQTKKLHTISDQIDKESPIRT